MADVTFSKAVFLTAAQRDLLNILNKKRGRPPKCINIYCSVGLASIGTPKKRGPRVSREIYARDQEIIYANAWLLYRFGQRSADWRYDYIAQKTGIGKSMVRKIIRTRKIDILYKIFIKELQANAMTYESAANEDANDKPVILRNTHIFQK